MAENRKNSAPLMGANPPLKPLNLAPHSRFLGGVLFFSMLLAVLNNCVKDDMATALKSSLKNGQPTSAINHENATYKGI